MAGMTDRLVAGYEVQAELGRDAIGAYYRAKHTETGKLAVFRGFERPANVPAARWQSAVKRLTSFVAQQKSIQNHQGVQKVLSYGQDGDLFYALFEYFEGTSLRDILRKEGAQSLDWVIDTFTQVANILDHAAERGVFHSDLNHYNIWINKTDATVRVLYFGLGRARSKRSSPYLAPEQLEGSSGDWRADVYSMGVLIYQALSGKRPFDTSDENDLREAIANKIAAPLYTQPKSVQDVVAKLLRKDPERRYKSCIEAINDLREGSSPVDVGETADKPAHMTGMFMLTTSLKKIPSGLTRNFKRRTDALDIEMQGALDQMQAEYREKKKATKVKESRGERLRHLWKLIPIALIVWAIVYSVQLPSRYRFAQVVKLEGSATADTLSGAQPLALEQWLDGHELKSVSTGDNSTLVLDMNGTRVKLGPNSELTVNELGYHNGAARSFALKQGKIWAQVQPLHGGNAKFEIACKGVKVRVRGTEFLVAATEAGAQVDTLSGRVKVEVNSGRDDVHSATVLAGEKLLAKAGGDLNKPEKMTAEDMKEAAEKDIEAAHNLMAVVGAVIGGAEESTLVPAMNAILSLVGVKTEGKLFYTEVQAVLSARGSLDAIAKQIQVHNVEEPPRTLNLETLDGLGFAEDDLHAIMKHFEDNKLSSYKALPNSGYEMTAHAKDSKHTVIHAKNGKVWTGDND